MLWHIYIWRKKRNTTKEKSNAQTRQHTHAHAHNGYNLLTNGSNIEIVDSYKYLGIFFSKTSNFNKAKNHLKDQADKALHFCIQ